MAKASRPGNQAVAGQVISFDGTDVGAGVGSQGQAAPSGGGGLFGTGVTPGMVASNGNAWGSGSLTGGAPSAGSPNGGYGGGGYGGGNGGGNGGGGSPSASPSGYSPQVSGYPGTTYNNSGNPYDLNGYGVGNGFTPRPQNTQGSGAVRDIVDKTEQQTRQNMNIAPVDYVDISYERALLNQMENAAKSQAVLQADYAVNRGVNDLTRNLQDSKEKFQTMQNQVDIDEAKARDNQVLYAEARGDRGGIGMTQYGNIQNTAAVNRLAVQREQTKLATDTARQIADLRAQGEFEKADKVLQISQSFLAQLMELSKFAKEANVGVQEFNAGLSQWQAEYAANIQKFLTDTELSASSLYGSSYYGAPTQEAWATGQNMLANAASALLNAGVYPNSEQLSAYGWEPSQATQYINNYMSGYFPYGIQPQT